MITKKYRRKMGDEDIIEFRKEFGMNLDSTSIFLGKYYSPNRMTFCPVGYRGGGRWITYLKDVPIFWVEVKGVGYKNKRRSHVDSQNKT